jgi:hypothetical protein
MPQRPKMLMVSLHGWPGDGATAIGPTGRPERLTAAAGRAPADKDHDRGGAAVRGPAPAPPAGIGAERRRLGAPASSRMRHWCTAGSTGSRPSTRSPANRCDGTSTPTPVLWSTSMSPRSAIFLMEASGATSAGSKATGTPPPPTPNAGRARSAAADRYRLRAHRDP